MNSSRFLLVALLASSLSAATDYIIHSGGSNSTPFGEETGNVIFSPSNTTLFYNNATSTNPTWIVSGSDSGLVLSNASLSTPKGANAIDSAGQAGRDVLVVGGGASNSLTVRGDSSIVAGGGGNGTDNSAGSTRDGGDGGNAVVWNSSNGTLSNSGNITGGNGGSSARGGNASLGGVGILLSGDNNTLFTNGTISGGVQGNSSARADAVRITGDNNTLALADGYAFKGNAVATGGNATLRLTGDDDASLDFTRFDGFETLVKNGTSVWTFTSGGKTPITGSFANGTVLEEGGLVLTNATLTTPDGFLGENGTAATGENGGDNNAITLTTTGADATFVIGENSTLSSGKGGNGGNGDSGFNGGNGGKGGQVVLWIGDKGSITNNGSITAGHGGKGGNGTLDGNGGNGGDAIVWTGGKGSLTNNKNGTLTAGDGGSGVQGGNGGNAIFWSGDNGSLGNTGDITAGHGGASNDGTAGGDGGNAIVWTGSNGNLSNTGNIIAGNSARGSSDAGVGVILSGDNNTLFTNGTISGGAIEGDAGLRADALQITGDSNTLALANGYKFNGNVVVTGANATIQLTGSANSTFNFSNFQNFAGLVKDGTSTWTVQNGIETFDNGIRIAGGSLTFSNTTVTTTDSTIAALRTSSNNSTFTVDANSTLSAADGTSGGKGGTGVEWRGSYGAINLTGNILAGDGDGAGDGGNALVIFGNNNTVTFNANSTLSGGLAGDGTTQAAALVNLGANTTINLNANYTIIGDVINSDTGTNARINMTGTANGTLDLSQFQNFSSLGKNGTSTWTVTGASAFAGTMLASGGNLVFSGADIATIDGIDGRSGSLPGANAALFTLNNTANSTNVTILANSSLTAGNGGDGADSIYDGGNGGNGGGGINWTGTNGTLIVLGDITAGSGGDGGNGGGGSLQSGDGGKGGNAIVWTGANGTLSISGTIIAGDGGQAGTGGGTPVSGSGGVGVYYSGANGTLTVSGSVAGGLNADGITQADAMQITGANSTLILESGVSFSGNVINSGTDTRFLLAGDTDGTLDLSPFGGFSLIETQSADWTLTGTTLTATDITTDTYTANVSYNATTHPEDAATIPYNGTLSFSGNTSLNGGNLTLSENATLAAQATTDIFTINNITANGTLDLNGGTLVVNSGVFNETANFVSLGSITKNGTGTLTVNQSLDNIGDLAINAGNLVIAAEQPLTIAAGGSVNLAANATLGITLGATAPSIDLSAGAAGGSSFDGTFDIDGYSGTITTTKSVLVAGYVDATGSTDIDVTVNILGNSTSDFLTVNLGIDTVGGQDLVANLGLAWNAIDPDIAHGNFTIAPADRIFTLNTVLEDKSTATNWDGQTLSKYGAGTLILSLDNTYTGLSTVYEGTLQIGDGGTTGSIAGNAHVERNAYLSFNRSNEITYAKLISGNGILAQNGSGTLILTNDNSFDGLTLVNEGILQIGDGGTTGSVAGNYAVTTNGTLVFNRSDNITLDTQLSGEGTLRKEGAGDLLIEGTHKHTIGHLELTTAATTLNGTLYSQNFTLVTGAAFHNTAEGNLTLLQNTQIDGTFTSNGIVNNQGSLNATAHMEVGTLNNTGLVTATSIGGDINNSNQGNLTLATHTSGHIVNNGLVNGLNSADSIENNARINIGGATVVTINKLSGSGGVRFKNLGQALTIGDLSGSQNFTHLEVDFADTTQSDRIVVTNSAGGSHTLQIDAINPNSASRTTRVTDIVTTPARSSAEFATDFGSLSVGMYNYGLKQVSSGHWDLVWDGTLSSTARTLLNTVGAASIGWFTQLDSLHKRLGELRLFPHASDDHGHFWARAYGARTNADFEITGVSELRETHYGIDIGNDWFRRATADQLIVLGVFAGYQNADRDFKDANGSTGGSDNIYIGGYLTWADKAGWFGDFIVKGQLFDNEYTAVGDSNIEKADYTSYGVSIGIEVGRQLLYDSGFFVEPSFQASLLNLGSASYSTDADLKVKVSTANILQAAGAVRVGYNHKLDGSSAIIQPYFKAGLVTQTSSGGKVRVSGESWSPNTDGERVQFSIGFLWQSTDADQIHFDYEYTAGGKIDRPWALNLGFRHRW